MSLEPAPSARNRKEAMTIAQVRALAVRVMGGPRAGMRWMMRRTPALDGQRPVDLLATEEGRLLIAEYLHRIAAGER